MPKLIRTPPAPPARWPLWVAGAALGALASWAVVNRRDSPLETGRAASAGAVGGGRLGGLARSRPAPDLNAIAARLRQRPGAGSLRVHSLGGGILELVGSAPDELDLEAVIDALATEPGVTVVVNRAWTSRSALP